MTFFRTHWALLATEPAPEREPVAAAPPPPEAPPVEAEKPPAAA